MKKSSSILIAVMAVFLFLPFASAQSPYFGPGQGGGVYEPGAFRAVEGQLGGSLSWPGSVWVSGNYADRGLGYRGSYLTVGAKTRLFEDFLDGRWLFEGRGHISEEGGFFGNLGIERIFSIQSAGADVSLGFWFDYDDDTDAFAFANSLQSVGVSGKIKTRHWDLFANGYFPVGTSDFTQGDTTGSTSFFENRITLQPGIDSALQGFDVTVRSRPDQLAFVNGSFDFGGYGYKSDIVEFFGGGRARLNFQLVRGAIFSGEINYDDRFEVTGLLGLTLVYGANARGHEYAGLAKDLDRTVRNDHIVRYNQDVVLAIDPDTGAAYNVIHVDNLADAAVGNGNFETPYATLADAEAASGTDDIIFVREGDGTTRDYDTGFVMQDRQFLLGDGVAHVIPIANGGAFGTLYQLTNDIDGIRPKITNDGNAVTLASGNTVRGFEIEGSSSPGVLGTGIIGLAGSTNTGGIIEDVMIRDAAVNGIGVTNLAGDWTIARNDIEDSGFNGISLVDACDPTSNFVFDSNVASNNGQDGIQIVDYDAATLSFTGNRTDSNGRDGLRVEGFKGDMTVGADIVIDNHTAQLNNSNGINVTGGAGSLTVSNSVIGDEVDPSIGLTISMGGNIGNGLSVTDFLTPGANDRILISGNDITSNGIGGGAGIRLELNEGFARALVTGNTVDANGTGLFALADDVDPLNATATLFDIDVVENVSFGGTFGGSVSDGMRYVAESGATMNVLVEQNNTGGNLLTIVGSGGNGISTLVGEDSMGVTSNLNVVIRDVAITGSAGSGVFGSVIDDGQLNFLLEDSLSTGNGSGFNFTTNANENLAVSSIAVRNVTATGNVTGFILNTDTGSFTDVAIINTDFTGSTGGDGLLVNAVGDNDVLNPQIDNRTRLFVQGSNFSSSIVSDGIDINVSGDASLFATLDGNTINGNGPGALDGDGIEISASNAATVNALITNNVIQGSTDNGVNIVNADTANMNIEFLSNNVGGSFFGDDFVATNGALSTLCLSFSNTSTFVAPNFATAGGIFTVELDGLTNGPAFVLPGAVMEQPFGSTCRPAIDAEAAAFLVDGFPVTPPPTP